MKSAPFSTVARVCMPSSYVQLPCEARNHADFLAQSPLSRSCRAVPLAKQVSISVYIGLFGNAITVSQGIAFVRPWGQQLLWQQRRSAPAKRSRIEGQAVLLLFK